MGKKRAGRSPKKKGAAPAPPPGLSTRFNASIGGAANKLSFGELNERMIEFLMNVEDGPLAWWVNAKTRVTHVDALARLTSAYFFYDGKRVYGVKSWTKWVPPIATRFGCVALYPIDAELKDVRNFKRMPMVRGAIAPLDSERNVIEWVDLRKEARDGLALEAAKRPLRRIVRVKDSPAWTTSTHPWLSIFKTVAKGLGGREAELMRLSSEQMVRAVEGYEKTMFLSSREAIEKAVLKAAPPQCEACGAGAMGEGEGEEERQLLVACERCEAAFLCARPECRAMHAAECVVYRRAAQ